MRFKTFLTTLAVAALGVSALAAPAFAAGRARITNPVTYVESLIYAGSTNGVGDEANGNSTYSYTWYSCASDTDPYSTRNDDFASSVDDVVDSVITTELSENGCVQDGTLGKDPIKPYATFTLRITSPTFDYSVYALGDGARLADITVAPTVTRNGNIITGVAGTAIERTEDLEFYRTVKLSNAWYVCPTARSANGDIVNNEPLSDCKVLYTGFEEDEGLMGIPATDATLDLSLPLYDTLPEELGQEVPANFAGRHFVYVTFSAPVIVWSKSVPFDAQVTGQKARKARTVYFDSDSAVLTAAAKNTLRGLVKAFRAAGTVETVRITGFVQPSGSTANDITLSRARAVSVRAYLKQLGVKAAFTIKASGRLKENSAKSRKAVVVISGTALVG